MSSERGSIWFAALAVFITEILAGRLSYRAGASQKSYFYFYCVILGVGTIIAVAATLYLHGYSTKVYFAASAISMIFAGKVSTIAVIRLENKQSKLLTNMSKYGFNPYFLTNYDKLIREKRPSISLFLGLITIGTVSAIGVFVPALLISNTLGSEVDIWICFVITQFVSFLGFSSHCYFMYHPAALWRGSSEHS
ncbi:hypothetical protein [Roseibium sp. TrichSKD4]|uniref:hypothetical protein n=1 Tax=Roseibium sp. TrichSKD4 TaxID=744980 RepID=UPI001AD9014C|nr:hypothetical protein [Roseibium sp. TrichSKD4]